MAIIDRDPVRSDDELLAQLRSDHPEVRTDARTDSAPGDRFALSDPGRVLLATASAAAGVIHLVMVPSHASAWLPEGIAFALAGWFQIGVAALLLRRPSAALLRVSCLANLVFIAAWAWTRVAGPPFGPEAGMAHPATFIDVTCVLLEAIVVVAGYELLAKPELGSRLRSGALVALSIVPVAILAVTTMAIASPSAEGHGHAAGGDEVAGAHDHATAADGGSGGAATGDHHEGAAAEPVDDKGLSLVMNGQGEGGGHSHAVAEVDLDPATQAELDAQLAKTQELVAKYPTVADAEAAGFYRQGPFAPGLGTHYGGKNVSINKDGLMDDADLAAPTLIYDGIEPDSKLAGFMYLIYSLDTENPPEGFAGASDQWHFHTNVCIAPRPGGGLDAPLGADTTTTQEVCDKYGGTLIANTGYMVHVWTVPGYESSQGTFSNVNPKLACADGTYYTIPLEEIGSRTNVCRDAAA
jgi:hypothetical protein